MADALFEPLLNLRASGYTCIAAGTILLYDILLTTGDEVRLIWPSRFSLVKVLYFINRYFPVPCLLIGMYHLVNLRPAVSKEFCQLVIISQVIGQAFGLIAATWLLVIRVAALYGGNRLITIGLYIVFIVTHGITVSIGVVCMARAWKTILYWDILDVCSMNPTRLVGGIYFSPVGCETLLVGLQLFHAYRHSYRMRAATPLLRSLYAHGFMYFLVVAALRLWTAFNFLFADQSYWYLTTYLEFALVSTSVSRLVLDLRGVAEFNEYDDETSLNNMTGPEIGEKSIKRGQSDTLLTFGSTPQLSRPPLSLNVNVVQSPDSKFPPKDSTTPTSAQNEPIQRLAYNPFYSKSGYETGRATRLEIPSTSSGWKRPRWEEGSKRESEQYLSADGDSCMEMSPVRASHGRDIRSMDRDEERGVLERTGDGRREEVKRDTEGVDPHGVGIG